ncbi:hypothetical protein NPIL_525521 [Nephila pilipes]|uniref:Uncharacterized protein n=1 Tax=Nephila pilipes TaxID=299642 RepID=A0A8X6INK6_NEPPI|nr:hypothetical protein NPIL_525521 [Nephila pilipes]
MNIAITNGYNYLMEKINTECRQNFKILYTYVIDVLWDFPWSHGQHLGGGPFHAIHPEVELFWAWEELTTEELEVRICIAFASVTAQVLQNVWHEMDPRLDVVRVTKGNPKEHL